MCTACTTVFEAPTPRAPAPPSPPPGRPPEAWRAPPPFAEPPTSGPLEGQPVVWNPPGSSALDGRTYSPQAVAAFVCGVLCCIPLAPFLAIFLGLRALKEIEHNPQRLKGRELAIVGIALGAMGGISWVLGLLTS